MTKVKEISKTLLRHDNVAIYLGKLTGEQIATLEKTFPDYNIERELFGYWNFSKK